MYRMIASFSNAAVNVATTAAFWSASALRIIASLTRPACSRGRSDATLSMVTAMPNQLSQDLVAAFDALFGDNPEFRAAHAKGVCCEATFTATPDAAGLTRAPHMQGSPVRTTVRFSNGSGDPTAHDRG